MTDRHDGGSAFPQIETIYEDGCELAQYTTVLPNEQFEAFAAAVDREGKANDALASSIAKSRTLFADAMIAARSEAKP